MQCARRSQDSRAAILSKIHLAITENYRSMRMIMKLNDDEGAQGRHDGFGRATERQGGCNRGQDHEEESVAIDFLATQSITHPSEEELAAERPAQRNTVQGCGDVGWQRSGISRRGVVVVDSAEEASDGRNAEEIVGVSEETQSRDHDGREMIPLRLCFVQSRQHVHSPVTTTSSW